MSEQSVQSNILDLAVAALPGAFRCRFRDFGAAELPARNVLPGEADPEYNSTDSIDRIFQFKVLHTVAAVDAVDKLADQLYVDTYRSLYNNLPFRAAVTQFREGKMRWEAERGELQQMTLSVTFEVQFSTSPSDPSIAGY